jgi:hypothetical protein
MSALEGIVLQKSKVAGLRIFRENKEREAIADSAVHRVTPALVDKEGARSRQHHLPSVPERHP